jgi:hypothetical protein
MRQQLLGFEDSGPAAVAKGGVVTDAATVHEDDQPADERPLEEEVWVALIESVNERECTPFLGAGVAWPYLPTGRALAEALADDYDYPLNDRANLARVAQFIASVYGPQFAKRQVRNKIVAKQEEFEKKSPGEKFPKNYQILADLLLPIYITTNYDDFLTRALTTANRKPTVEVCRWNNRLYDKLGGYSKRQRTVDEPVIFHMHGEISDFGSLLVTDDDYIDFTVSLGQRAQGKDAIIPHWIRRALTDTTLLFVGYSLEDMNFRVLMRQLMKQQALLRDEQALSLSIQLSDKDIPVEKRAKAEKFLADYLGTSAIRIYWGQAAPFLQKLGERVRQARG